MGLARKIYERIAAVIKEYGLEPVITLLPVAVLAVVAIVAPDVYTDRKILVYHACIRYADKNQNRVLDLKEKINFYRECGIERVIDGTDNPVGDIPLDSLESYLRNHAQEAEKAK